MQHNDLPKPGQTHTEERLPRSYANLTQIAPQASKSHAKVIHAMSSATQTRSFPQKPVHGRRLAAVSSLKHPEQRKQGTGKQQSANAVYCPNSPRERNIPVSRRCDPAQQCGSVPSALRSEVQSRSLEAHFWTLFCNAITARWKAIAGIRRYTQLTL